ncbi:unnamed protein product [Amoebophrya sp. A25]|nr:unnamed protein product [Amoebophrya sp. A25]|eukprot:GSA25T00024869001.1
MWPTRHKDMGIELGPGEEILLEENATLCVERPSLAFRFVPLVPLARVEDHPLGLRSPLLGGGHRSPHAGSPISFAEVVTLEDQMTAGGANRTIGGRGGGATRTEEQSGTRQLTALDRTQPFVLATDTTLAGPAMSIPRAPQPLGTAVTIGGTEVGLCAGHAAFDPGRGSLYSPVRRDTLMGTQLDAHNTRGLFLLETKTDQGSNTNHGSEQLLERETVVRVPHREEPSSQSKPHSKPMSPEVGVHSTIMPAYQIVDDAELGVLRQHVQDQEYQDDYVGQLHPSCADMTRPQGRTSDLRSSPYSDIPSEADQSHGKNVERRPTLLPEEVTASNNDYRRRLEQPEHDHPDSTMVEGLSVSSSPRPPHDLEANLPSPDHVPAFVHASRRAASSSLAYIPQSRDALGATSPDMQLNAGYLYNSLNSAGNPSGPPPARKPGHVDLPPQRVLSPRSVYQHRYQSKPAVSTTASTVYCSKTTEVSPPATGAFPLSDHDQGEEGNTQTALVSDAPGCAVPSVKARVRKLESQGRNEPPISTPLSTPHQWGFLRPSLIVSSPSSQQQQQNADITRDDFYRGQDDEPVE